MDGFQELLVMFKSPGRIHTSRHTIFCKKHTVRINSNLTPNNKTLFTLGWPPYCSKEAIEDLFSRAGHVNSVYLCMNPGQVEKSEDMREYCGFHVAYVVFSTESEAMSALNLCLTSEPIPCHTSCVGLSKWSREYMLGHPSVTSLEAAVEEGVALYDRRREEAIQKQKKAGEPDEDGWITVTRKTPKIIVSSRTHCGENPLIITVEPLMKCKKLLQWNLQ